MGMAGDGHPFFIKINYMAKSTKYEVIKEGDVYITGKKFELRKETTQKSIEEFVKICSGESYPGLVQAHVKEVATEQ